jgi:hypothetical protein
MTRTVRSAARNAPPETLVQWWIQDLQRGRSLTRQELRVQRLRDKYGPRPIDVGAAVKALTKHFGR